MLDFTKQLFEISEKGLQRSLRSIENLEEGYCNFEGKRMLNLSSNDYLGLATYEPLKLEFTKQLLKNPDWLRFGSSSSRLLTGNTALYDETELLLKNLYGAEAALFFNSGYHANAGILPAISGKRDLILSDKLCHASMIDGIRLSSAEQIRYRHLDYNHLESLLQKKRSLYNNVFIVSESIFSMDGDEVDLRFLVQLKHKYDVILYVDEAHAVGAVGENGLGLCELQGIVSDIDILVGTMGKALASVGAYAIFSKDVQQMLINKARTLLFTTALPSVNMAWSKFIIERISSFKVQRKQLERLCNKTKEVMQNTTTEQGFIAPFIVGGNDAAVQLSLRLQKLGYLVFAIRPPTVPVGTSRLRLSLTANIKEAELLKAIEIINSEKQILA